MSAESVPEVGLLVPATAFDMGHPMTYVSPIAGEWRSTCGCHHFWLLDPEQAAEAFERMSRW